MTLTFQHEESIEIAGLKINLITCSTLIASQQNGALVFIGSKQPTSISWSGEGYQREESMSLSQITV